MKLKFMYIYIFFISLKLFSQNKEMKIFDKNLSSIDFNKKDKLKNIDFVYIEKPIVEIPKEIFMLENLKGIRIQIKNDIVAPKIISDLKKIKNLEILEISGNNYNIDFAKPNDFFGITKIPTEINQLIKLKKLEINGNLVSQINLDSKKLVNIETLNLFRNKIKSFPLELLNFIKIKNLGLENNYIKDVPEKICETMINDLTIGRNSLKEIPKCLLTKGLDYLFINENFISNENIEIYRKIKNKNTSLNTKNQFDISEYPKHDSSLELIKELNKINSR